MSRVDVIIPCYKYAHFLRSCAESVLSQEGVDVRILILDDCSPDNTTEVAAELQHQDSRVEYRRHEINQGHIASYNEGLEWASADYSLLLSADDLLVPGALARAAKVMNLHPEVGMTYGFVYKFYDGEQLDINNTFQSNDFRCVSGARVLEYCCKTGVPITQTAAAVVRTSVQHKIGGYRNDLPHSGDMEMWMRFAVHGPIGVVRATQGFYRRHGNNMSDLYYNRSRLRDRRERLQAFNIFFAQWASRIKDLDKLRLIAMKHLSNEGFWMASRSFDLGDVEGAKECLIFSEELYPEIRRQWVWSKMQAKVLMGSVLWRYMRPLVDFLRPQTQINRPLEDRYEGWWPNE